MLVYLIKRLLLALPTLLVVSFLGFCLMRFDIAIGPWEVTWAGHQWHVLDAFQLKNPIDPLAALRNNPQISAAAIAQETQRLGLDKPFLTQYWLWLSHLCQVHPDALWQGHWQQVFTPDLGRTFSGESVVSVLCRRTVNTLLLNVLSVLVIWGLALPLGMYAAIRWRRFPDRLMTVLGALGMAIPGFVVALLLALVAVKTGWLPLGGLTGDDFDRLDMLGKMVDLARHLALPVLVMSIGGIAGIQRQVRSNLLDVLQAEYVRTARAKGLPEHWVLYGHALRVAINPLITLLGFEFAGLLSGTVLIETVLGYPGLGLLTYEAVLQTDTNLVLATLVLSAAMLVLGNLLADVMLGLSDPRIRTQDYS